jgi:glycosyltransferase involved in cell wall biosynthesis
VCTSSRESTDLVTFGASPRREIVPLPVAAIPLAEADGPGWRNRWGIPASAPVILFFGRINYKKGLPLLVDAVARMRRTDAVLVIAGSGSEADEAAVHDAVREAGLGPRAVFTGWLAAGERISAYAAAQVFALLSDNENFGIAVIEAASAGCAVLISDQVYIADDLAAEGAAVVVPRSAEAAARALDALLDDEPGRAAMGQRGCEVAVASYRPRAVGERLIAIDAGRERVATGGRR